MLDEIAPTTMHKEESDHWRKKKYEVNPVENINKNPQRIPKISPVHNRITESYQINGR